MLDFIPIRNTRRPVVSCENSKCWCLIDSGAEVPVWMHSLLEL